VNFLNYNPFLRILFPFLLGITLWLFGYEKAPELLVLCAAFGICVWVYLMTIKKARSFSKLFFGLFTQVFLFLTGWGFCQLNNEKENPHHYTSLLGSEPEFYSGYISDLPAEKTKSVKAEIVLQQAKVKGQWKNTSGKIIVYFQKNETAKNLETGNTIIFSSQLQEVTPPLNPHEFDYKNYLKLKNIFYTAYLKEGSWSCIKQQESFSFYGFAQKIRKYLLNTYKESGLQDSEFAMVAALVLGYDDQIDQPLMNAYSHTGTLHVLSVSGLHVGVIYLMLGYLLAFMKGNKKIVWLKVFLILSFLWFFVLLSGFSAPAVRAALMFSLILIGKTLFENVEVSNIVFVSAFISLCYNPLWLADAGFQLSYVAVLGIIYLYPRFYNMFAFSSGFAEKIWALCSVSIAAQLATLPITLYYFHQFPVLFLVTNMLLIPVSTIVMYGGILVLVFSKVAFISKTLVWLTATLIKFMNASALFFDQLPFCMIDNIHLSLVNMVLMYILIVLVFIAIEYRSYKLLMSSFGLTILMLFISLFYDFAAKKNNEFVIYHSDKNSTMDIFTGNDLVRITDTSADYRLASTLRENRIYHDVISEKNIQLGKICLLFAGNKKILYVQDGSTISKNLLQAIKPDFVWLPSSAVKIKKQRKHLCKEENFIVSGKFYKKKNCFNKAYFTQNKGAFTLSLP